MKSPAVFKSDLSGVPWPRLVNKFFYEMKSPEPDLCPFTTTMEALPQNVNLNNTNTDCSLNKHKVGITSYLFHKMYKIFYIPMPLVFKVHRRAAGRCQHVLDGCTQARTELSPALGTSRFIEIEHPLPAMCEPMCGPDFRYFLVCRLFAYIMRYFSNGS